MADLEEHAFKRDKRFLVRLILALLVGVVAGAFLYAKLTSPAAGTCAARGFEGVTEGGEAGQPGPQAAPEPGR